MTRRGLSMLEAVTALTLSVTVVLGTTPVFLGQLRSSRTARDELRAREALQAAKQRLDAGVLAVPTSPRSVASDVAGVTLRLEPLPAAHVDPRLDAELRPARLTASWRAPDGQPRSRTLTVLVAGRTP